MTKSLTDEEKTLLTAIAQGESKPSPIEKDRIMALCFDFGLEFSPTSTRCNSCYRDAAIRLLVENKRNTKEEVAEGRKYALRDGLDVIFNGQRVNDVTHCTDESIERLLNAGFPTKFVVEL